MVEGVTPVALKLGSFEEYIYYVIKDFLCTFKCLLDNFTLHTVFSSSSIGRHSLSLWILGAHHWKRI